MWLASLLVRLLMRIITLPVLPALRLLKHEDKQAVEPAGQLMPDHLIELILLQLPAKTLLKFRRVCKQWDSTISSPAFATLHVNNLLLPTDAPSRRCAYSHVIFLDYSAQHRFFPSERAYLCTARITNKLSRVKKRRYIKRSNGWMEPWVEFHSSCNGLVCMARLSGRRATSAPLLLQVWNLATGKHKEVASLPLYLTSEMSGRECLRMMEDIIFGFGYDSTINDFKIVFMYRSSPRASWLIQVMSLKTNTWWTIDYDLSHVTYCWQSFGNSVSVAGNVYWLVESGGWCMVLKCMLGEERFELLSLPEGEGKLDRSHNVGEYSRLSCHNGSLYIFLQKHFYVGNIDIWMLPMADDASAVWHRVATMTIPACLPLGFDCNGHVIMSVADGPYYYHRKLFAYLLKENKFVKLDSSSTSYYFHLVQMETLACP